MSKLTEHKLSRRGFVGAAAGTAAAAAAATTLGPLRPGAGADADPSAHDMKIPTHRIGWQIFTFNSTAWSSEAQALSTIELMKEYGVLAMEGASGRYAGFPHNAAGMEQYAQFAAEHGFILVGDHNGPAPSSAANANLAVSKMASWEKAGNPRALGQGAGTPGEIQGNTQEAQINNVNAYLAHAELLNTYGDRYQNGFQGSDSLEGARYYQHMHREWKTWDLLPDGHKYKGKRQAELLFDPEDGVDEDFAFIEIDLAWIHEGVRVDANRFGGWTLQQIQDEVVRLMGLYGDRSPFFHVKDVNATGGAQHTGDPAGDAVPFQRVFQQLKDPGDHYYLIERDGAGADWPNVMRYGGRFLNGVTQDHTGEGGGILPGIILDRSLVGAPANVDEPEITAPDPVVPGKKLRAEGDGRGTWVRLPKAKYQFKWLRDEVPIPGANKATYITTEADAGKEIKVEVRAENNSGSTVEQSAPVAVQGAGPKNTTPPSLSGSGKVGTMITCDRGEWEGSGSYSYEWRLNGVPVPVGTGPNETGSTNPARYRAKASEVGQQVTCHVTRTSSKGSTTVPSSNSVTIVA